MQKDIEYVHIKMYYVRFYMHSSYKTLRYHVYLMYHYHLSKDYLYKYYIIILAQNLKCKQIILKTIIFRIII